jgi:pleiotropic regulator 1
MNLAESTRLGTIKATSLRKLIKPKWHRPFKLYRVIVGHHGWVRCLAISPCNTYFASGSADRTIKFWDLASGELKISLTGHINTIRAL